MRGGGVMTAERIKALREARGWTQAELARRLGGPRQTILCIDRLSAWRRKS